MTAATEHPQPVHLAVYDTSGRLGIRSCAPPTSTTPTGNAIRRLPGRDRRPSGRARPDHGRHVASRRHRARRAPPREQRHADPSRRGHLALRRQRRLRKHLAPEFLEAEVPVAAICGATAGLAAAGLLDDRRHTSNAPEFVEALGPREPSSTPTSLRSPTEGSSPPGIAPVDFAREDLRRARAVHAGGPAPPGTSSTASTTRPATSSCGRGPHERGARAAGAHRAHGLPGQRPVPRASPRSWPGRSGLTAAHWQVLGAVLDDTAARGRHRPRHGHHPPDRPAHSPTSWLKGLAEYLPNPAHRRAKLVAPTEAASAAVQRIGPGHTSARRSGRRGAGPRRPAQRSTLQLRPSRRHWRPWIPSEDRT